MKLILEKGLEHQQRAVQAIADLFEGIQFAEASVSTQNPTFYPLDPSFGCNLRQIQANEANGVRACDRGHIHLDKADAPLPIDIKMETGTGKTYVYTQAIYELNKRYGFRKFIVVVPSLAIKAGARQFLSDPSFLYHFKEECAYKREIRLSTVERIKSVNRGRRYAPGEICEFCEGGGEDKIDVLLVNKELLMAGKVLSRDDYDITTLDGASRPFDMLRNTRPIVIIDEPHRFSRDQKAYEAIVDEIRPQCIIRFGATFPDIPKRERPKEKKRKGHATREGAKKSTIDYRNLLYDLDAAKAFNSDLVKGIYKEHFSPSTSGKEEKVKILSIESRRHIVFSHITKDGNSSHTLGIGDSLGIIAPELSDLQIEGVDRGAVCFSNGQEKRTGEQFSVDVFTRSYQEAMIQLALERHFETERDNFACPTKIKTLALFFIDDIAAFRGDSHGEGAWLRDTFDRLLKEALEKELTHECATTNEHYRSYLEASLKDIAACRAGYFARDNADKDDAIVQEVDEILHNKKKLLSLTHEDGSYNTRRFLFSKWTLKEGWDNPNVFTIAKLRSSGSEISKLQEVGRGLRLPVDENGTRVNNKKFYLNYIVDFTEANFANKLVAEINQTLPEAISASIPMEEIIRVAELRKIDKWDLLKELEEKEYITAEELKINPEYCLDLQNDYPEFELKGINPTKVRDRNKTIEETVKIRQEEFDKLKTLWQQLNRKYIIYYDKGVDASLENALPELLEKSANHSNSLDSKREKVIVREDGHVSIEDEVGRQLRYSVRPLPYNLFLQRIHESTYIPIRSVHRALCQLAATDEGKKCLASEGYFSEATTALFSLYFKEWKTSNLVGRIHYYKLPIKTRETRLTKKDGNPKESVTRADIGLKFLEKEKTPKKYLYDTFCYDSDLEKEHYKNGEQIDSIVVYGKIPRRSIAIPTIAGENYSPDFMYVVKKADGTLELNLIIECKGIDSESDLRGSEKIKIACAKAFFEEVKEEWEQEGVKVTYRLQLNRNSMESFIKDLL